MGKSDVGLKDRERERDDENSDSGGIIALRKARVEERGAIFQKMNNNSVTYSVQRMVDSSFSSTVTDARRYIVFRHFSRRVINDDISSLLKRINL